ncbi:MAG TPA: ankyrin repeat domain-containing protein, partial [Verrucomicrobiales bacterium]|nr:ankyrin repeat domain-containing protein [Verrucomicrobiales bacterium]
AQDLSKGSVESGTSSTIAPVSILSRSAVREKDLAAACRAGQKDAVADALAAGADPNDSSGPLSIAASRNEKEIVDLLISYGADASRCPEALPSAVHHKNAAMATALLNAGADPNLPDASGVTSLGAALKSGEADLARLMFQHGGYPDDFVEPAMEKGDTSLMGSLFQYGLTPDRTDANGNPLLVRATLDGKMEMVKLLLEKGADPKKPGKEGQPALHLAAMMKNEPLVKLLLEGGADPNQPFLSPVKPAFLERVDDERFKKWLQRDAGLTPLMLTASRGDISMLKVLLEKGARRGLQTKNWQRYPVVFACDAGQIPAAQILLGRNPGPDEPEYRVIISLSKQRATLYKDDEAIRTCRVSTGRKGFSTPTGRFVITDKQKDWVSTIYKVSMPFFMRLSCMEIGMHAGNCPGYPASHGCIRMPQADVQNLYSKLRIGDAVTIEE